MAKGPRHLTIYIPEGVRDRLEKSAARLGMSRSEFVRHTLDLWAEGLDPSQHRELLNRSIFLELATDALLKNHTDPDLRERVHNTYKNRLQRRQAQEEGK